MEKNLSGPEIWKKNLNYKYTADVFPRSLHGCMLDLMHLRPINIAGTARVTNEKVCPHNFGHIMYLILALSIGNTKSSGSQQYQYLKVSWCSYKRRISFITTVKKKHSSKTSWVIKGKVPLKGW